MFVRPSGQRVLNVGNPGSMTKDAHMKWVGDIAARHPTRGAHGYLHRRRSPPRVTEHSQAALGPQVFLSIEPIGVPEQRAVRMLNIMSRIRSLALWFNVLVCVTLSGIANAEPRVPSNRAHDSAPSAVATARIDVRAGEVERQPDPKDLVQQRSPSALMTTGWPAGFVENEGQADPSIRFYRQTGDSTVALTQDGLGFHFVKSDDLPRPSRHLLAPRGVAPEPRRGPVERVVINQDFVGANTPTLEGQGRQAGMYNFILG